MRGWFRALPLMLGMFLSVLAILFASDFVRGFYVDPNYLEDVLVDNADGFVSLGFSFLCALTGFPLALRGIDRLTRAG